MSSYIQKQFSSVNLSQLITLQNKLLRFNPSRQLSTTQLFSHCPRWMGDRIGNVNMKKSMIWHKYNLIGKAKATCASKAKQGIIHHFPRVFSHFQDSWDSPRVTATWEDKHRTSKRPSHLLLPPSFYYWAQHHAVWNMALVSCGQQSWLHPLPFLLTRRAAWETETTLMLCNHCTATLKHQRVVSTVFITNPKHSTSYYEEN